MTTDQDHPGVVILPSLLYLAALGGGLLLQWRAPIPLPGPAWLLWTGPPLIVLGLALASWARRVMAAAGTHVDPRQPATAIVTSGPFRFGRNPMYVAITAGYVGIALWARSGWLAILLVPALAVMHFGVVLREERYLGAKFGETYAAYRNRVRRYL